MEKLLNLLNEYDPYIASDGEHKDNIWDYAYKGNSAVFGKSIGESVIISKKYLFIEWLIKNKKIDLQELVKKEMASGWDFEGEKVEREDNSEEFFVEFYTEITLMLLAIHDNPIELLIDLLR